MSLIHSRSLPFRPSPKATLLRCPLCCVPRPVDGTTPSIPCITAAVLSGVVRRILSTITTAIPRLASKPRSWASWLLPVSASTCGSLTIPPPVACCPARSSRRIKAARARSASLSVSSLLTSFSTPPLLTRTTPLAVSSRPCSLLTGAASMVPPFATQLPPKPTSDRLPRTGCGAPRAPGASVPWSSNRSPRPSPCHRSEPHACRLLRFRFSLRLLCLSRLQL